MSLTRIFFCGMITGATMMVPGASGGSMAMILGIYDRLISAVSSFGKHKKENFRFLSLFVAGGLLGIILFSMPLSWMLEQFPVPTGYFFLGAVVGGMPMIYRKSGEWYFHISDAICIMSGILMLFLLTLVPEDMLSLYSDKISVQSAMLILVGVPVAAALVLPGISVSHFLLIFGLYQPLLDWIREFQVVFLVSLSAGIFLGIILITKFLEYLLEHFSRQSCLVILGFMAASLSELFPGIPKLTFWPICILSFVAGFSAIYVFSGREFKNEISIKTEKEQIL